jgi:hypothetical protein
VPSRRSQRGKGLRAALERTQGAYDDFKEAEEDRARFDSEFEYWQSVGYEEWDNLDADTRADLLRSSLGDVVSSVGSVAANRNPIAAGGKKLLQRMAPNLAKRIYARSPSKGRVKLMDRIKKVRSDRAAKKQAHKEEIEKIESDLLMDKALGRVGGRPASDYKPAASKDQIKEIEKANEAYRKGVEWWETTLGAGTIVGSQPLHLANQLSIRELLSRNEDEGFRIRPEMRSLVNKLLEAGENRDGPVMSEAERKLREHREKKQKERSDNMYTATDEEWDAAFRRRAKE